MVDEKWDKDKYDGLFSRKPVYILMNLDTNKPIGYYDVTEDEILERDGQKYLEDNPQYTRKDIGVSYDKWGLSVPRPNEVGEWL